MTDVRVRSNSNLTLSTNAIANRAADGPAFNAAGAANVARDAGNVSNAVRTLARLQGSQGLDQVSPGEWQGVMKAVAGMGADQRRNLFNSLLKQGLRLDVQPDGEISLFGQQGAVTGQPDSGMLRVTIGGDSTIYQGTQPLETIKTTPGGNFVVTRDGKTQLWDAQTGIGLVDGKPIPPRWADPVPGEAPRKPWPKPLPNKLVEPDGDAHDPAFWKKYDDAVVAAGGEVVEPLSLDTPSAERYNCHSFATTGAHGNLTDPFDKVYQPRWVNFPTYELKTGAFKQLKPDQQAHVGDVVVYAKDGAPTHTGVVKAVDKDGNPSEIESKWGAYGLYRHGPFDVPRIYGDIQAIYRPDAPAKN